MVSHAPRNTEGSITSVSSKNTGRIPNRGIQEELETGNFATSTSIGTVAIQRSLTVGK